MELPVVLNELSYEHWVPTDERVVGEVIRKIYGVLRGVQGRRRDFFLLSKTRLSEIVFPDGLALRRFFGIPALKEEMIFIFGVANRSPFSIATPDLDPDGYQCTCAGESAVGLVFCRLLNGLLVSCGTDPKWGEPWLEVEFAELVDGAGAPGIVINEVRLAHASLESHVEIHDDFIRSQGVTDIDDGDELWIRRSDLFPSLIFLPNVEAQLRSLGSKTEAARQVGRRLAELQSVVAIWRPAIDEFPQWRSRVSPEGETRKRLATFNDATGVAHIYDLHARYTPGAGRIHFRMLPEVRQLEIAYVGMKLT
jgi:hypothetical protein